MTKPNGTPQPDSPERKEGHSALRAVDGKLVTFDPHPATTPPLPSLQTLSEAERIARDMYDADRFKRLFEEHLKTCPNSPVIITATTSAPTLDLIGLRDCLVALRDSVYCPECRCPNWATERGERISHYPECKVGKFTELLLKIVPKEGTRVRWKQE